LAHSDMFAAATLLSPALYAQQPPPESSARSSGTFGDPFQAEVWAARNYPAVLETYLLQQYRAPVFILSGDDDWNHPEGFEYNIEQQAVLLYGLLNRKGGSPAELRIVNGGHNWRIWQPGFIAGIEYMMQFIAHPDSTN
ncbi:MAG: esterase family protein, partial [Calditrichaeota bacterium]|nr:esterase family protein [Calditrichota bacterium]